MKPIVCRQWLGLFRRVERDTSGDCKIKQANHKSVVVLIEPDSSVRDALVILLCGENWNVTALNDCSELQEALRVDHPVAVVSESSLPDCTPQTILEQCNMQNVPVIFTGHELSLQGAVDLIRQGATDYLDKPFPQGRLVDLLKALSTERNE